MINWDVLYTIIALMMIYLVASVLVMGLLEIVEYFRMRAIEKEYKESKECYQKQFEEER